MARRRHSGGGSADSGTWMNTYADMVTLLLTFFAVLLSMSSVNEEKFIAFIRSFTKNGTMASSLVAYLGDDELGDTLDGESVTDENAMSYLYEKLSTYVNETGQSEAIEVYGGDNVVYIRFNSAAFFEPDRYVLRPGGEEILSYVGDALKTYEGSISHINICGHTANPPGASAIGVWMLSGERAAVVASYFEEQKQIESDKMIIMGYGKNFPIGDNSTAEGMEKNRRVELVVIGNDSTLDQDIYSQFDQLYDNSEYPANGGTEDVLSSPTDNTPISNSAQNPTNLIGQSAAAASVPAAHSGGTASASASTEQAASP
ncbi:MAG: flagellar motor protein MotB [Faecalibacterium sp.]|jgi:chemotaxis protein MotB|nr:flagellar motor protein MotB [Faecalibacterium sp.]